MSDRKELGNLSNANFPVDGEGRVYHLGCKKGEIANIVLTVGDGSRAKSIGNIPGFVKELEFTSPRNFTIITGKWNDKRISIVSSNMGYPNIDFVVRELRYCVEGPMAIVRFGTCGTPDENISVGDFGVTTDAIVVQRNPDAFRKGASKDITPYVYSARIPSCEALGNLIEEEAKKLMPAEKVHRGLTASADSFYSSQGRVDPAFDDRNANVIDEMLEKYPDLKMIEMESATLLDLADVAVEKVYASACAIILAQRKKNDFLSHDEKHRLEVIAGTSCLNALTKFEF